MVKESFDIGDTVKVYDLPESFATNEATLAHIDIQTFIFGKSGGFDYVIKRLNKLGKISGYTMKTTRMVLIEKNIFNETQVK